MWKRALCCIAIVAIAHSFTWQQHSKLLSKHRQPSFASSSSFSYQLILPSSLSHQDQELDKNDEVDQNRRSLLSMPGSTAKTLFLLNMAGMAIISPTSPAHAAASPSADVRANLKLLFPATRVRIYIDQAVNLCSSIQQQQINDNITSNGENENDIISSTTELRRLQQFLENEPSFMTKEEEKLSKQYLEIKTSEAWQQARKKERETRGAEIGVDYTTPYDKVNTAVQSWGDNRQFQILRSRQKRLEQSSTIRTAFNAYTNNLVFGDSYKLNVLGDEKKNMVRSDALPNVNAVVVSDLDLRDLYRNQVLQNIDDAKAETEYQLKSGDINIEEILIYLKQAQSSCQDWFDLIPKGDVEEAFNAVSMEP